MARCSGVKRDGARCAAIVRPPLTHCYAHDPDRAAERKANASRAGKSTGSREITNVKARLVEVIGGVLDGSLDRGQGAVVIQGFNCLRGMMELERKVREQEALEDRISVLEAVHDARRAG